MGSQCISIIMLCLASLAAFEQVWFEHILKSYCFFWLVLFKLAKQKHQQRKIMFELHYVLEGLYTGPFFGESEHELILIACVQRNIWKQKHNSCGCFVKGTGFEIGTRPNMQSIRLALRTQGFVGCICSGTQCNSQHSAFISCRFFQTGIFAHIMNCLMFSYVVLINSSKKDMNGISNATHVQSSFSTDILFWLT